MQSFGCINIRNHLVSKNYFLVFLKFLELLRIPLIFE